MDEVLLIFFGISLDGNIGILLFCVFGNVVDIISSMIVEGVGGWLNCVVVIWGIVVKLIFAPINLDSFSNAEFIKKKSAGLNPATKVYLLLFEKEFFKSGIMNISFGLLIIVVIFGVIGLLYVWLFLIISVDWIGGWLNCVVVILGIVLNHYFAWMKCC